MIRLKSEQDIKNIKIAIKIGEFILDGIVPKPGMTTLQLNNLIEFLIINYEATPSFKDYENYPYATCISINEEIIHGLPSNRILQDGDIVKIDVGIKYNGYFSDQARTYIVGKVKNPKHYELVYVCKKALEFACQSCQIEENLNGVSQIIEEVAYFNKLGILQGFGGHGVGFGIHEEPFVPNYAPYNDVELKKGMVICLEPMFVLGKGLNHKSENGWTIIADGISAHEEKTIIIG